MAKDTPKIEIKREGRGAAVTAANVAQPPRTPRSADKIVRRGVGIKESTFDELQRIAKEEGLTPNAVMKFGLEYFAEQYRAGPAKVALRKRKVTRSALT